MKLCKNCKTELEDNQKFCYHCGSNEFEAIENVISDSEEEISVQPKNVIESDLSKSIDGNQVGAVVDSNVVKKSKNKKKLVKIIVPIVAAMALIVASLGIFSLVNYNNFRPYREMLEKLESSDFIYYQEYDEISKFDFTETDAELNFFEKILNIRKVCEIRLTPHIYYLYDKDLVEDNEALYDLIAEEEDEEAYSVFPRYCELLIEENGDTKIVCGDDILFNINLDNDKNIVSVIYNDGYTQKEYINTHNDSDLKEKSETIISEYESYLGREMNADSYLYAAENASLYYNEYDIGSTIADFASERISNPEITIEAHRYDEKIYIVTVSGDWMYNSATVVFRYNSEENVSRIAKDSSQAFTWYIYEEFPSYAYFPM